MAPTEETKTKTEEKHGPLSEIVQRGMGEIMEATRAVNAFPQGASRDLYCAYPSYGKVIDQQSDRILGLISQVLKSQNVRGNIQRRQQDEQFEMLLDCNDTIMERLNLNLDDMAGIRKGAQPIVVESVLKSGNVSTATSSPTPSAKPSGAGSWNLRKSEGNTITARLITAKNIPRSQLKFTVPVDNSASEPFIPKLKEKPNSLKPLAVLPEYNEDGTVSSYLHPYEFELMKFEVPESLLKRKSPKKPQEMSATELVYVDSKTKLQEALTELRGHKEIAIDVEHHSYRTFLGFTCLIQVSTRVKDYLFDALELREELHVLNQVFTDPKVVKIFHGADSDIEWLQRDLSLYVVNMFDTHQAAKALNMARLSLSFLLKHYCDIEADKAFQLADWRIRPLPAELVAYARQDTHFLIYIYECIVNDLLDAANNQTNLVKNIFQRSNEICKKRYVKPTITAESHLEIFRKSKRVFDNRQLFALREIFLWRDGVARLEDESYGYVLPNHMMLQIAESLPREMQGILACCNPVPPLIRQNLHVLHQIILRAREQPLVKPILETDTIHRVAHTSSRDYSNKLYCPHDLSHNEEVRDDLPTLLHFNNDTVVTVDENQVPDGVAQLSKPALGVFAWSREQSVEGRLVNIELKKILTPYQRYLAILPVAEEEKREEAARIEEENKKRKLCPTPEDMPPAKMPKIHTDATPEDNDPYSLPIKEMLKRKYEESVANRKTKTTVLAAVESDSSAKRLKTETPTDDKLNFSNLPPAAHKQAKSNNAPRPLDTTPTTASGPSTSQPNADKQNQRNPHKNNKHKKVNRFPGKSFQSSNQPVASQASATTAPSAAPSTSSSSTNFDYMNVDFKKFQGGAKRARGTEIKSQFHGKGNPGKAQNKKFNKLFTFSNVKSKK